MTFKDKPELLLALQDEENGFERRKSIQLKVLEVIKKFIKDRGVVIDLKECDVLLDIPLRKMNLGGNIFVRGYDGKIDKAINQSELLKELERSFGSMSKVLRVFVAPGIRRIIYESKENQIRELRKTIYQIVAEDKYHTEVK